MDSHKWTLTEIITVVGVILGLLGAVLVFASKATDRIAIIEVNIMALQHDVELAKQNIEMLKTRKDPLVDARLERQRLDIEKLAERVDELGDDR